MVLSRCLSWLLGKILSFIVPGIDISSIEIDWFNGFVVVEKVFIPGEHLRVFPPMLPIHVKAIYIGKLSLRIQLKSWFLHSIEVAVDDVFCCLDSFSVSELSGREFELYSQSLRDFYVKRKNKRLKALDNQLWNYFFSEPKVTDVLLRDFLTTLVAKLFAQFKVAIGNLHIRLEDIHSTLSGPVCCGVFIEKLLIERAFFKNSQVAWDLTSLEVALDIHKYVHLKNLNVYFNSYMFPSSSIIRSAPELLKQMQVAGKWSEYQWLIYSFCFKGSFNLMFPLVDTSEEPFKISIDLQSSELNVNANTEQIKRIAYIATYMTRHAQLTRRRLRCHLPICRPKRSSNVPEWWQYAYQCVLDQINIPTRICPLCTCARYSEFSDVTNLSKSRNVLHESHCEIQDMMRLGKHRLFMVAVYSSIVQSRLLRKKASNNIALATVLSEEELILGRMAAYYYITYLKGDNFKTNENSSMNRHSFEVGDKMKNSRIMEDNDMFADFVLKFQETIQKGTSLLEMTIKLTLSHFIASAWDYSEDDKMLCCPPLLSLKGTDLGVTFSTAKQLPNICQTMDEKSSKHPMSGYLLINMNSSTLSVYDEYAPTLQKVSTISFLSGQEKPCLNLLLCLYYNFRLVWEAEMLFYSDNWMERLSTRQGPFLSIDIFGIHVDLSSLDALVRIIRFSLNCIPKKPIRLETLSPFRVFGPKEYWTQVCRRIQQPKLKLQINLGSAEINVLCKEIQTRTHILLQLNKLSFWNVSPNISMYKCFENDTSLFLYEDWIVGFHHIALDLSFESFLAQKLSILHLHSDAPCQLLFSTCCIPSDFYLFPLNIKINCSLYAAIDFSEMEGISLLTKAIQEVIGKLRNRLMSSRRVVYIIWGEILHGSASGKAYVELYEDGLLCLSLNSANEDAVVCERLSSVELESNNQLDGVTMKLRKVTSEICLFKPYSVYAMEDFLHLLDMQTFKEKYRSSETFLIAHKRKLDLHVAIDWSVEVKLPVPNSPSLEEEVAPTHIIFQLNKLELFGKFSLTSISLEGYLQAMKILYGNETSNQRNIHIELAGLLNSQQIESNPSKPSSSQFLQLTKETLSNDSSSLLIFAILHSLEGYIWSSKINEILELLTSVNSMLQISKNENDTKHQTTLKTKPRVQLGLNLQVYSSRVEFVYPDVSDNSSNGMVFRKLALSLNDLYFSLNTSHEKERLRLCVDLGPKVSVSHTLMAENVAMSFANEGKILSFYCKDEKSFPLHFDMSLNAETETQNSLTLTFRLSHLRSLYNHFAIMDLVVTILHFVALGNARNVNKKKVNSVTTLLNLQFTLNNPTISIPCFDDTGSLCDYLQCNSRFIQLGINVKNEGASSSNPNDNSVNIDIKGDDWKVDQGFVVSKETTEPVFILVPLLYPSNINLNIALGSSHPLNLSISSSYLSVLLRKASILDILGLVFPTFVTYPYTLLQGNKTTVVKEDSSNNKKISIKHHFDRISVKWFDENSELLLPDSVFAMELPLETVEELTNWNIWNDFIDAEWIRNELISNTFVLELLLNGQVDDNTRGVGLDMSIASDNIHIRETYSLLYDWRYFSRVCSVVTIGRFAFSLSLSPISFSIRVTSEDNQPLQLYMGITGTKQLMSNIVYIVKSIPNYINSIRRGSNEVKSATTEAYCDSKQWTWDIDIPIELHFVAGISKARSVEINDGFHELIFSCKPSLRGTIQTHPYLEIPELSCFLHQLVCIHRCWNILEDKCYNLVIPIEISLELMEEESENRVTSFSVSKDLDTDSLSKSILFHMTRIEGYLMMEDVVLILSCIKECKECLSSSNDSHAVRKMEDGSVASVSYKRQLSYNLNIQMDDIRFSLISIERGSSFSIVETAISNIQASGVFWPWTKEYSFHSSLLWRLYQFAIVHGTWNNLLEPCQIEFVAMKKLEDGVQKQQMRILFDDIQITVTETWLHSLISWIARWKDVSVLFISKVSFMELQHFENSISSVKENTDSHSSQTKDLSLTFNPTHSRRSVLIRNETGLDIMLTECKWEKEDVVFCKDMKLRRNSEQVIHVHSRFLDRIHRWMDTEDDRSLNDQLEQSIKMTITFLPIPLKAKGKIRLFQEDVYFFPVFETDGPNEMGTLCLQLSLLEAQWMIVVRSVFKFVNNTNFGLLFLLEDSVGNIYDPSLSSSSVNRIISQLYQVPFLEDANKSQVFAVHERGSSSLSVEKALRMNSGSNFVVPFVFSSWTCYVRFAVEDAKGVDEALTSHWSDSVQLKEEFILKGKHVLLSFPIRWTKPSKEDIVATSYYRKENGVRQHSFCLAQRKEYNSQSSAKRPMDLVGAVLLQCQPNGEMTIMAPLHLKNELTLPVSYRIYVGIENDGFVEWVSWKDLEGRLQPGETIQKYCLYSSCLVAVEWFQLGDLLGTFVESSHFHHMDSFSSWKKFMLFRIESECLVDQWNASERKRCLREHLVTFQDSDGRQLQVQFCLLLGSSDPSLLARLSCPYWVSNCTGIPLLLRDTFGVASGIPPTIENIQTGVEDTFPIMMSLNHAPNTGMSRIGRKGLHYLNIWIPECPKSRAVPVSILGFHSLILKVACSSIHRLSKLSIYSSLRKRLFEAASFLRLNIYTQLHPSYEDSKALSILPETLFCFQGQDSAKDLQKFASFGIELDHVAVHSIYLNSNAHKTERRIESESHATHRIFQWVGSEVKVPLLYQNMPKRKQQKLCIRIGFRMSCESVEEEMETQSVSVSSKQEGAERNSERYYYFLWSDWFAVNAPSEFTVAVNIPKDMQQLRRIESLQVSDSVWKRPFTVFDYPHPEDFMLDRMFWIVRTSRDPSTRTQFVILKKPTSRARTEIKNKTIFLIAYGQENYLHGIRLVRPQTEERLIWNDPLAARVVSLFIQHRQGITKFRLDIKNMGTQVVTEQVMSCDVTDSSYYQLNATVELVGRVLTVRLESTCKSSHYWTNSFYSSVAQRWNFLVPWKRRKYSKLDTRAKSTTEWTETGRLDSFHFHVNIPFIGVSFIDDEELWEELFYISLSSLLFSIERHASTKRVEMTLAHFQCDQSITSSDSPVLVASLQHPFFSLFLQMESFETVNHYNQVDVSVAEFALKMDNELLFRLLELIKQRAKYFSEALDSFHIMENVWLSRGEQLPSTEQIFTNLVSPHLNRTDLPSYFEHVILHPIACRFSFTMKGNFEKGWLPFMESWMRNTGLLLGEIEDNLLWVDQLELNNAVETLDGLSRNILWHVVKSLWSNMFTALGGLSALGDMTSTVLHLRQGTLQFFVEPIRGSLTGEPHSLWKGVHRGTIMLGRSCIYSVAQPISRLSWAVAKGIAYGSMNRAFLSILRAHEEEWKHATDIWNGTLMGLQRWRTCLSYMCNVSSPFESVSSDDEDDHSLPTTEDTSSLAAVSSMITLPLSGFFFFISNVAEGTRNMTGLQVPESERVRLPRMVIKGYPIRKYDAYAAKGQYLLRQSYPQRRERYVMHMEQQDDISHHHYYYILSTSHITALKQPTNNNDSSSRHIPATLLWRIPLTAIQQVNITSNEEGDCSVAISFRLQSTGWQSALQWLDPSRMVASSSAVVTTLWRHEKSQPTNSSETVTIRETRTQKQHAIEKRQPTLAEWEEKLSNLLTIH